MDTGTAQRVEGLQVVVRDGTPFLPKVAFALITLASMAGVTLTSTGMGLTWAETAVRWLALWSLALAGGFLLWRLAYLRSRERDVDDDEVVALHDGQLAHATPVARWVALVLLLGAPGALVLPTVAGQAWLQGALVLGPVLVALLLLPGLRRRATTAPAAALVLLLLLGWAWADAAPGWPFVLRALHLVAFALWIGGALWNITVAMPAGREHPTVDAVLAGARQLDRFRWVVRFSLPTIIVTGLLMAGAYRMLPLSWWVSFPGVLIPVKVLAIVALVVVFVTCPLFRHCSPVQGVCDIEDLAPRPAVLDNRRTPCAVGLIRAAREIRALEPGALLEVWTRDRVAPVEIPVWVERDGHEIVGQERRGRWPGRYWVFEVRRGGGTVSG